MGKANVIPKGIDNWIMPLRPITSFSLNTMPEFNDISA